MIFSFRSNFCVSRGRIISRRKTHSKTSSVLVCSPLLFYLLSEILPRFVPREVLRTLLLFVLTHHHDLSLGVVDVEGIEVSPPLLKTWLGVCDVMDVADSTGDRRIPKDPNSVLESVLDSRLFEIWSKLQCDKGLGTG